MFYVFLTLLIPNVMLMLLLMYALLANILYDLLGNQQVINLFYLNLPRLMNNVFYTMQCVTGTIYQTCLTVLNSFIKKLNNFILAILIDF